MNLEFANKHPFLFCAMMVSCAIAIGGRIASASGNVNFSYGIVSCGLVALWIFIGIGYAISKGFIQ